MVHFCPPCIPLSAMGSKALASVACAAAVAMLCLQVVQLYASVHHLLNSKVHSPSLKPHRHYCLYNSSLSSTKVANEF